MNTATTWTLGELHVSCSDYERILIQLSALLHDRIDGLHKMKLAQTLLCFSGDIVQLVFNFL